MSSPKKIAVLVHNDVMRDARVRKQARSLVAAGHTVDVFGFSVEDSTYPNKIENGARLKIETMKTQNPAMKVFIMLRSILGGNMTTRIIAVALLASLLNTLLLLLIIGGLFAPWLVGVLSVLVGVVMISTVAAAVLFRSKRQYIEDWIKVNWGYGAISRSLARNVIGKGYDAVHCHDIIALLAGEMIKKEEPGITMVWDAHELYTELSYKTPYMSQVTREMISRIAPRVDKMVTISPSFVDIYAKEYPKLPRAEVVMNATRRPVSEQMDRSLLRDAAGVSDKQKILLFQGGIGVGRGVELLLQAAPKLPLEWSVVFMGYGPLQDKIEVAANAANSSRPKDAPCIAIIPPAPQEVLRDWTSGADLGIIPYENTSKNHLYCTPNKLWEYPNARVPVLATDLVEMNKIISDNGTGLLLPRDFNSADIVSVIEKITDAQLEEWRTNCDVFNESENWEKFEPNLLKVHA